MLYYFEQRYPVELEVTIVWYDTDGNVDFASIDWIKGLNAGHALYRARQNWPDAVVEPARPSSS